MTARVALAALVLGLAALGVYAWFGERTAPAAVAARIAKRVSDAHAGTTMDRTSPSWLRLTMASGIAIDLATASTETRCRAARFDCDDAVRAAARDVDGALARASAPRIDDVRAVVAPAGGGRYGQVTTPFADALETRFAIADTQASTFVTRAMADRLPASVSQLLASSIDAMAKAAPPAIVAYPAFPGVFDVTTSDGDPAARLLVSSQASTIADALGSSTVVGAVPERGVLWLARPDASGRRALDAAAAAWQSQHPDAPRVLRFTFDTTAP